MEFVKVVNGLEFLKNKQQSLSKSLQSRNGKTYIVPTGFGLCYGALCFVLLITSIGFSNNLLYACVFGMISIGVVSMWQTNQNVDLLDIEEANVGEVFALEENHIDVTFKSKKQNSVLYEIVFVTEPSEGMKKNEKNLEQVDSLVRSHFVWIPQKRGWQTPPIILIESKFPFRFLRSWKYLKIKKSILVYPQKKGQLKIQGDQSGEEQKKLNHMEYGLFRDHREFSSGDSMLHIDWKRSLKHQKLLIKNFEMGTEQSVIIDWKDTSSTDFFENKISQMAQWVYNYNKLKVKFKMIIGDYATDFGQGEMHYHACMKYLSLLEEVKYES